MPLYYSLFSSDYSNLQLHCMLFLKSPTLDSPFDLICPYFTLSSMVRHFCKCRRLPFFTWLLWKLQCLLLISYLLWNTTEMIGRSAYSKNKARNKSSCNIQSWGRSAYSKNIRPKVEVHKTYNHRDLHGRSAYSKNTTMAGQHTAKKGRSAKGFLAGQHKPFFCWASADLFIGPVTACGSINSPTICEI